MTSVENGGDLNLARSQAYTAEKNRITTYDRALDSQYYPEKDSLIKEASHKVTRIFGSQTPTESETESVLDHVSPTGVGDVAAKRKIALANINRNPALNPGQLNGKREVDTDSHGKKALKTLHKVGSSIIHPKRAIKAKATKTTALNLSKPERSFLTKDADIEYLKAYEDLKEVETNESSYSGDERRSRDAIVKTHRDGMRQIEEHRDSLRAAWVTGRHVRRARVVPRKIFNSIDEAKLVTVESKGQTRTYEWIKWIGPILLYYTQDFNAHYIEELDTLPFDINTTRQNTERLMMSSGPWQLWLMKVRAVYRWESPKVTARWLALFAFLWYTEHIMGFVYSYIIYMVLRNRFYPSSIESLNSSMQRAQDSKSKAYRVSELIDKHGNHNWLDPFIGEIGPHVQLQLGDIANLLEVLFNFYNWKSPYKTSESLIFFAVCLLVTLFADMAYCVKIVWFITGGAFFFCYPVSSRYPKYRYLVSPLKWVFWDIPTHAEWSFQFLYHQAQEIRELLHEERTDQRYHPHNVDAASTEHVTSRSSVQEAALQTNGSTLTAGKEDDEVISDSDSDSASFHSVTSSTSILESTDLRSFRAYHPGGIIGHFIVSSTGIRFRRSRLSPAHPKAIISNVNSDSDNNDNEIWNYPFTSLSEVRKFDDSDKDVAPGSVTGGRVVKILTAAAAAVSSAEGRKTATATGASTASKDGGLEIVCVDGRKTPLRGIRERDEAFNAVIAFSGLRWQSLPPGSGMG